MVTTSSTADPWLHGLTTFRAKRLDGPGGERTLMGLRAKGRPAIFVFWATYCPPCLKEMPMFSEVSSAGHHVVGVSMDAFDDEDHVRTMFEKYGATYPQVLLTTESMKGAGRLLDEGLPFTLVLTEDGDVHSKHSGMMTKPEVLAAIEAAR